MDGAAGFGLSAPQARDAIERFAAVRGEAALRLAMHAAVPQALHVDLLHALRLNFAGETLADTAIEADVLFAPFSHPRGNGYFGFDAEVRVQLLRQLDPSHAGETPPRSTQVADFLLAYLDRERRRARADADPLYRSWLEVERWNALAFADPAAAAEQLAAAVRQAVAPGQAAARLRVSTLAASLAMPLVAHRRLLAYAAGVDALDRGDVERGRRLLGAVGEGELAVGGVTLGSVAGVLAARVRPRPPAAPAAPVAAPVAVGGREVFISFTYQDQEWRDRIAAQLAPDLRATGDEEIPPGRDWGDEVRARIARARVALVLASPQYLASEFRVAHELPLLRERQRGAGLPVHWVMVRRCSWQGTLLEGLLSIPLPGGPGVPLDEIGVDDLQRALMRIGEALRGSASHRPSTAEAGADAGIAPRRTDLFLSFAEGDEAWAERLAVRLDPVARVHGARVLRNHEYRAPAQDWAEVSRRGIARARIAIALLSPEYFVSKVTVGVEQSLLLDAARDGELTLAWVCLRPCDWERTPMARYQCAHDPSMPLDDLARRAADETLDHIAEHVDAALRGQKPPAAEAAPAPSLRVLLSSTHVDLVEARAAVHDRLARQGYRVLQSNFAKLWTPSPSAT
jgi:hypothetical protein